MATLAELRTITYDLLNDTDTSQVYQSDVVDRTINEQELELATRQQWQFLSSQAQFNSAQRTQLSATLGVGDTVATVASTENFDTSGRFMVDKAIIPYTGKTSTTFTGVSGVTIESDEGAYVYKLYSVPDNFLRTMNLTYKVSGGDVFIPIPYVHFSEVDLDRQWYKFSVLYEGANNYIVIYGVDGGYKLNLYYQKSPDTLSDDANISSYPDEWAKKIIPKLAAAKLKEIYNDNLEGEADMLRREAADETAKMFKVFGIKEDKYRNLIKSRYQSRINDTHYNYGYRWLA